MPRANSTNFCKEVRAEESRLSREETLKVTTTIGVATGDCVGRCVDRSAIGEFEGLETGTGTGTGIFEGLRVAWVTGEFDGRETGIIIEGTFEGLTVGFNGVTSGGIVGRVTVGRSDGLFVGLNCGIRVTVGMLVGRGVGGIGMKLLVGEDVANAFGVEVGALESS